MVQIVYLELYVIAMAIEISIICKIQHLFSNYKKRGFSQKNF